ncbi:MAG: aminopeptidase P family protein [Ruminococcus sp.]|nr:aminopeptidase P family protein [Ruminococcus sp.]
MPDLIRLREFLPDGKCAALVTSEVSRRYLSGFPASAGAFVVTQSRFILAVDFRYYEAAQKAVQPPIEVVRCTRLIDDLNRIFLQENIESVYIEDESVTVAYCSELQTALIPQVLTEGLSAKLNEMRLIKSDEEVEKIITAQRITERAYTEVLNMLKPGVTERQIAVELEHLIKVYGGERVAFDLICITGENTSLPHGVPGDRVVKEGDFFTFDIGAVYDGYHSDMTRTVAVKSATDEMRMIYETVLQAHLKAARAITAGNTAAKVDIAARDHIDSCGYGAYFGHSTGHGVGLMIHEDPTVYRTNHTVLRDNMVITDEPGIYLPGRFGVRIEDMYLVKGEYAVDLAGIPKELTII